MLNTACIRKGMKEIVTKQFSMALLALSLTLSNYTRFDFSILLSAINNSHHSQKKSTEDGVMFVAGECLRAPVFTRNDLFNFSSINTLCE